MEQEQSTAETPKAPITIGEAVQRQFCDVFHNTEQANEKQARLVHYAISVANQMGVDIREWPLFETLTGTPNAESISTLRGDINRNLFEAIRKRKGSDTEVMKAVELTSDLATQIMFALDAYKERETNAARDSLRAYQMQASNYLQSAQNQLAEARELKGHIQVLTGYSGKSSIDQINEVLKKGFWTDPSYHKESKRLSFLTAKDVHISWVNSSAGVNYNVNMGRFRADLDLNRAEIRVHTHENNLTVDGTYHPHIDDNGRVCWGNARDMVARNLPAMKFEPVMEALAIILTHYNDESPYVTIDEFYQLVKDGETSRGRECEDCGAEIDSDGDCECPHCDVCDDKYAESNGRECSCCMDCMHQDCTCEHEEEPADIIRLETIPRGHLAYQEQQRLRRNDPRHTFQLAQNPTKHPEESDEMYEFRRDAYSFSAYGVTTVSGLDGAIGVWRQRSTATREIERWYEQARSMLGSPVAASERRSRDTGFAGLWADAATAALPPLRMPNAPHLIVDDASSIPSGAFARIEAAVAAPNSESENQL